MTTSTLDSQANQARHSSWAGQIFASRFEMSIWAHGDIYSAEYEVIFLQSKLHKPRWLRPSGHSIDQGRGLPGSSATPLANCWRYLDGLLPPGPLKTGDPKGLQIIQAVDSGVQKEKEEECILGRGQSVQAWPRGESSTVSGRRLKFLVGFQNLGGHAHNWVFIHCCIKLDA